MLPTSGSTALIEALPNAPSLHAVKASLAGSGKPSLAAHFFAAHPRHTPAGAAAQRRFVESMAAYSLATHLLAIKDRHNGNILLCADGSVVHVDYGFMLGSSPGGVGFEAAPFKLSRELAEVMDSGADGASSPAFDAFKVLIVRGFLSARRAADRLVGLAEVAAASPHPLPCFRQGEGGERWRRREGRRVRRRRRRRRRGRRCCSGARQAVQDGGLQRRRLFFLFFCSASPAPTNVGPAAAGNGGLPRAAAANHRAVRALAARLLPGRARPRRGAPRALSWSPTRSTRGGRDSTTTTSSC